MNFGAPRRKGRDMKIWWARAFRLSIVAGITAALLWASMVLNERAKDIAANTRLENGYACAARLTDEMLRRRVNVSGNVNIKGLCTGDDFFVSFTEVAQMRAGHMKFETIRPLFDGWNMMFTGLLSFVGTMMVSGCLIGLVSLSRWVWSGRKPKRMNAATK